jgi:hypothetical protein
MKQQREQIKLIAQAAKAAGYEVRKLGSTGETMLGDTIQVSSKNKFWLISTSKIGFFPNTKVWFKMLCNSKETSCKLLKQLGYGTVPSLYFGALLFDDSEYFQKMSKLIKKYPVVCKPEDGVRGRNIRVANNEKQLQQYYLGAKKVQGSFLVQPIITGNEYRIAVYENKVFAMHNKNFYAITGNGSDTIASLCKKRKSTPDMNFVNHILIERGYSTKTVLPAGEKIPVKIGKNDGDTLLTESNIPKPVRDWALTLCKKIGCTTVGIDVIIPKDVTDVANYKIFELNASPAFSYLEVQYGCRELVDKVAKHIVKQSFK